MRRECTWAGMVFHTLPGISSVMPICNWQVGEHLVYDHLVDVALVRSPSSEPMWGDYGVGLVTSCRDSCGEPSWS